MRRLRSLLGRGSGLASALIACGPGASTAPQSTGHYGEFHNPFPAAAAAPAEASPPATPAEPATPAAPAAPSKHCGPACGMCSRASETCDEEIRTTGQWNGPQCRRKESICGPLVALKNATGCTCD